MAVSSAANIVIVVMPFYGVERPALGPSQLAAQLRAGGHDCRVLYVNIDFARRVGIEPYERITESGLVGLTGEWVFAEALWGPRPDLDQEYLAEIAAPLGRLADDLPHLRREANVFVDQVAEAIDWSHYTIVGFSSMFDQQLASLALARRIAEHHPDPTIVFGGANCEGEMGRVLHERFDFVDVVCRGEADQSFPSVVDAIVSGGELSGIDGICFRDSNGGSKTTPDGSLVTNLDDQPFPDFGDFFEAFDRIDRTGVELEPHLQIETARGCWWGEISHCTFCGINGSTMEFRAKSPGRVLDELRHQTARHGITSYQVADAIMDMRYFPSLLPQLAEERPKYDFWWEVKANLTHRQIRALVQAGATRIQPGIESMSNRILDIMGKGSTPVHNIQFLKWSREFGARVDWNFIYGFPGEPPEEYEAMAALVWNLVHLEPPSVLTPIRIDRFSPHHNDPDSHGLTGVEAMPAYRYLYPFDPEVLNRIAYFFTHAYADGRNPGRYVTPLAEAIQSWWSLAATSSFTVLPEGDEGDVVLDDRRQGRPARRVRLRDWKARAYLAMDRGLSARELSRELDEGPGDTVDDADLASFLDFCERHGYVARFADRFVALAVHHPPRWDLEAPRRRVLIPVHAG